MKEQTIKEQQEEIGGLKKEIRKKNRVKAMKEKEVSTKTGMLPFATKL